MLVVKLELWPGGDPAKAQSLGTGVIVNDGTSDTVHRGNYNAVFGRRGQRVDPFGLLTGRLAAWRRGRVTGFTRLKSHGWELLHKALSEALSAPQAGEQPSLGEDEGDAVGAPLSPLTASVEVSDG